MADLENTENETENELSPGAEEQESQGENKTESPSDTHRGHSTALEKKLKELRRENASYRNRAKENEQNASDYKRIAEDALARLSKIEEIEKTVTSKIAEQDKRNAELEKRLAASDSRAINAELERQARAAGVVDIEVFQKIIDPSELKLSANGEVVGVKEVIDNLKKAKPFLFDNRLMRANTTALFAMPQPAIDTDGEAKRQELAELAQKDPQSYKKELTKALREIKTKYK